MRTERGIVIGLFLASFLIVGLAWNTTGVFFQPLLKEFGWSRAQLSLISSVLYGVGTLSMVPSGWLVDRIEAGIVTGTAAVLCVSALLLASQAHSYAAMLAAYLMLGVSAGGGIVLPTYFVVANWFSDRRGVVMGITTAGASLGGMSLNVIAGLLLPILGWRQTYLVLAMPILFVVFPIVLITIKRRPSAIVDTSPRQRVDHLSGFDLRAAIRTASFWIIAFVQLSYSGTGTAAQVYFISYLIKIGYSAPVAATFFGVSLLFTGAGRLLFGLVADWMGARSATVLAMCTFGAGFLAATAAQKSFFLALTIPLVGIGLGAEGPMIPLLIAECFGLKYFGTITGTLSLAGTAGLILGPVLTGGVAEITGTYRGLFMVFALISAVAGLAAIGCRRLESDRASAQIADTGRAAAT
jgi:MFS family permease